MPPTLPQREPLATQRLQSVVAAAALLRDGRLVAFPTETVYGLGVDARNTAAVERLFQAKGRPADNPLIVHLSSVDDWPLAARTLTESAATFLNAFAPGPLTVVLPKHPTISHLVTAGLDSVGVRIPASQEALELLREVRLPIAAPSANRSGRPSCTTWLAVLEDLDGRIDAVLEGRLSAVGLESTVVDCCGPVPVLLRPGAISLADLQSIVPSTIALSDNRSASASLPASPGLRHPHYQPTARVHLIDLPGECEVGSFVGSGRNAGGSDMQQLPVAFAGLTPHPLEKHFVLHAAFETVEEYAMNFYEFLRRADRLGAHDIFLQRVPDAGLGQALSDRQRRAAGM